MLTGGSLSKPMRFIITKLPFAFVSFDMIDIAMFEISFHDAAISLSRLLGPCRHGSYICALFRHLIYYIDGGGSRLRFCLRRCARLISLMPPHDGLLYAIDGADGHSRVIGGK